MAILLNLILLGLEGFTWLILINIVASWLIAFGVLNYSSPLVFKIMNLIYRVTEPVLSPIREVLPSFGGMDFSPIVLLLAIQGVKSGVLWMFWQIVS